MKYDKYNAFSLVELAVVISVISLLIALGYSGLKNQLDYTNISSTADKLNTIQNAIENYRIKFHQYPCPAPVGVPDTDPTFGVAATNCFSATPANTTTLPNGFVGALNDIAIGNLPFVTLDLPSEMGKDSWGNSFSYSVDARFTQADNNCEYHGSLTILDYNGNTVTTNAVYTVISHGIDGSGAYNFQSGGLNYCNPTTLDYENCENGNKVFREGNLSLSNNLSSYYDDMLKWATNPNAKNCLPGLSSCNSWYDASDKCTVLTDASNNVIMWLDKSANSYNASVPTGSTSPTYITTTGSLLNGLPYLNFNGTTQMLSALRSTNPLTNISYGLSFQSSASQAFIFGKGDDAIYSATNNDIVIYIQGTQLDSWVYDGSNETLSTGYTIDSTVPHYVVMTLGSSRGYRLDYDGVNVGSSIITTSTNGASTLYNLIGGGLNCPNTQSGGACYLNGSIHEIIFFDKELSSDEERILNNYLNKKWK